VSRYQDPYQNLDIEIANIFLRYVSVQVFGNDSNKTKLDSERNEEEIEL
jgi:hypothetical protein